MTLNSLAPLVALKALAAGLSGVQATYAGVPESLSNQVTFYVTLAGQTLPQELSGKVIRREARYRCVFAYAVDDAEATAESTVASLVDAFILALLTARPAWVADATLGNLRLPDLSAADTPEYSLVAGAEIREYPIVVSVVQQASYA